MRAEVERWRRADPETDTVCAFEIIAATAQSAPGPSGLYRARISAAALNAMIALARENSCLTILDLQVGWSSVPVELPYFTQWLSQPDVHLVQRLRNQILCRKCNRGPALSRRHFWQRWRPSDPRRSNRPSAVRP